jgi:cysteinyl-tRNA synthetase
MGLLGFPDAEDVSWFREREITATSVVTVGNENAEQALDSLRKLLLEWQTFRDAKNYEAADNLKSKLERAGLKLKATSAGPTAVLLPDFDPAKLEALK